MKYVIAAIIIFAIGWAFSPFALAIWFIATHSISTVLKALAIAYVVSIPVSVFYRP